MGVLLPSHTVEELLERLCGDSPPVFGGADDIIALDDD